MNKSRLEEMVKAVMASGQIPVTEEELEIWDDDYTPDSADRVVRYATYLLEAIDRMVDE